MGSYVQENLSKDEQLLYEARLHWIIFVSFESLISLLIVPYIKYATSEFAITSKRIIIKLGLISRQTLELNLNKIESVNVNQSIPGRILGFGTIVVIGTGGTRQAFDGVADPMAFRRKFLEISG